MDIEFQDWELLQASSDSESAPVDSLDHGDSFDEIDSIGLIQADYFSLDSENRGGELAVDAESVRSENPSWIDPRFGEGLKEPAEFWTDSGSERSEDRKFGELEEGGEVELREIEEKEVEFEGEGEDLGDYCVESGGNDEIGGVGENSEVAVEGDVNLQVLGEEMNGNGGGVAARKNGGELEKKGVVWWKMPMEFLKYCMIRMSPVWTVSVAAAVMGFLILGRRLYKMKKKTKGLEIKVAVDDKKASQVMSRAARLNEAFSVVKLVPVIRPSLPALGSTGNWTAMSLR